MKKLLIVLGLLVIGLFIVGCGTGQAVNSAAGNINKNDAFLLPVGITAPTTSVTVGEILQYKGADKVTADNPKIKFKLLSAGESLEYAIPLVREPIISIKLGGKEFKVKILKPSQMDSPIQVDFDGDGIVETNPNKLNLFNKVPASIKGLGYFCDDVATIQEGEIATLGDGGEIKLIYIDSGHVKVSVLKMAGGSPTTAEVGFEPPLISNGETWTTSGYDIHHINILYQAYAGGIHQAAFCINY